MHSGWWRWRAQRGARGHCPTVPALATSWLRSHDHFDSPGTSGDPEAGSVAVHHFADVATAPAVSVTSAAAAGASRALHPVASRPARLRHLTT